MKRPLPLGDAEARHERLQRRSHGYVGPEAFTHGSSEQRTRRLMASLKSGQRVGALDWRRSNRYFGLMDLSLATLAAPDDRSRIASCC